MNQEKGQYFGHLIGKNSEAGRDLGQKEKGMTEDEMVGWHHRLNGCGFGQTPGDGEESACNEGDPGLSPGLGRSPGKGNGNPL